ncbi:unnamed protein product [Polarella glacialis]|uniref:PDZ domain-containing protein n=1 Tax=Polarella glacialis TaxID=89957 RepID=A0A813GI18_POLGL|nr:unnamed protein product [Polarella glacialis]
MRGLASVQPSWMTGSAAGVEASPNTAVGWGTAPQNVAPQWSSSSPAVAGPSPAPFAPVQYGTPLGAQGGQAPVQDPWFAPGASSSAFDPWAPAASKVLASAGPAAGFQQTGGYSAYGARAPEVAFHSGFAPAPAAGGPATASNAWAPAPSQTDAWAPAPSQTQEHHEGGIYAPMHAPAPAHPEVSACPPVWAPAAYSASPLSQVAPMFAASAAPGVLYAAPVGAPPGQETSSTLPSSPSPIDDDSRFFHFAVRFFRDCPEERVGLRFDGRSQWSAGMPIEEVLPVGLAMLWNADCAEMMPEASIKAGDTLVMVNGQSCIGVDAGNFTCQVLKQETDILCILRRPRSEPGEWILV